MKTPHRHDTEFCCCEDCHDALNARVAELEEAIRWACGESDDGFERKESDTGTYWWRTELRERAKLPWDIRFHEIKL